MMTYKRAQQILASYGGQPTQWPVTERAGLERLLQTDKSLQELQQQALRLDQQLAGLFTEQVGTDPERLAQQISNLLPGQQPARINPVAWLRESYLQAKAALSSCHRGGMAAVVALALLLAVGLVTNDNRLIDPLPLPGDSEDPWILMADALDNTSELELFAVLEPGLFEESSDQM